MIDSDEINKKHLRKIGVPFLFLFTPLFQNDDFCLVQKSAE